MKSLPLILSVLLFFTFSLRAENRIYERVFVHTDKDCYVAGEDILLDFYVVNRNFQPSTLSRVGYVEICDTQKPQMQLKVALEKGRGAGKIEIPINLPSGIYRLSGYTRYMRNEGENAFFDKQIAIVNVEEQFSDHKRFESVENFNGIPLTETNSSGEKGLIHPLVKTDQNKYGNRSKVLLSLSNIPDNAADLVISVSRDDSIAGIPDVDYNAWLKQVADTLPFSGQWLPEYEGHIITGRFVPDSSTEQLISSIAFVGNDMRYFIGKSDTQNGTIDFYTAGIFGKQQIVTSAASPIFDNITSRVDLLSPYSESLPDSLPVLQFYPNEKQLMERYIGVQIKDRTKNDSLNNLIQSPRYCNLQPVVSYNLNEYTRFGSISETILEYVYQLRVSKLGGRRRIRVFMNGEFNQGNTLVLLDGVPIYNHEDILAYNPMYIKTINIYDNYFLFGGIYYEGIVSFLTFEGDLPLFQLNNGSQQFDYDCPQLPPEFESPDYSIDGMQHSKKPDFRHTLYWNPSVKLTNGQSVNLSFYTSDLCGEFKITVKGITTDGKEIQATSRFQVTTSP